MSRFLEHLLTARIGIQLARTCDYPAGGAVRETVVPTDRLIWLSRGRLRYRIEDRRHVFSAGAVWLVPAWTRRSWQTLGQRGCRLAWVELVILPSFPAAPLVQVSRAAKDLHRALQEVVSLWQRGRRGDQLLAEMELKRLLARVVHGGAGGRSENDAGAIGVDRAAGVAVAVRCLRQNLADPDALARAGESSGLSARAIRARFRAVLGMSPSVYLHRLRMEQARFDLMTSDLSVKQVAAKVGFGNDPLYFSRRYRQFWGRPPSEDRAPNP